MDGLVLVISPLIALMKDQLDFLTAKGLPAARLDSTLGREATIKVYDELGFGASSASVCLAGTAQQRAFLAVDAALEDLAAGGG